MAQNNVISIVVDRLHAGMIGAYGNSWIRTTSLDRLAGESFVFDQAFLDGAELARLYRSYWLGVHAADGELPSEANTSLPRLLAEAGVHTALVTDEVEVAELPGSGAFAERVLVDAPPVAETASDVSETGLARLFGAATDWLASPPRPFFLWVHCRGMAGPWDAPLAMRRQFADAEDPQPPNFVAVPDHELPQRYDPDDVLGVKHAYAGQMAALDRCVGALCEQIEASGLARDTQLTFLSARGFPLGEHRRIGVCDEALFNELAQLVWMMRFPDSVGKLARSQALVQPPDLPGTLVEWLGLDRGRLGTGHATSVLGIVEGRVESLRDRVLLVSRDERGIRTPAWYLRQPASGAAQLYAKPADRWEVNEVANLVSDVVSGLEVASTELQQTGRADSLPPLADRLVNEVD